MKKINLKKLLTASILLLSWVFLSLIFVYSKTNITVISKTEKDSVLTQTKFTELLKGEKIAGRFTASENYLGQISVRFYNFDRINKDEVDFKLFSADTLIYEHIYKTDQFLPNGLFPFGFATLPDSKGQSYNFEITSIAGRPEDAITLSSQSPLVATSYQYPKSLLLKHPTLAMEFLFKKISYTEFGRDFVFSVVEYFVFIALSLFLINLFLVSLLTFKLSRLKSMAGEIVVLGGLILISFSAVLYYLKMQSLSELLTIYGYFLIIIGVVVLVIKARSKN